MEVLGATQEAGLLDDLPRVTADAKWIEGRRTGPGFWSLTTRGCPYCRRRHFHASGDGPEPVGGHKVPHCVQPTSDPSRGYVLVVTPAPAPGQQKRRR